MDLSNVVLGEICNSLFSFMVDNENRAKRYFHSGKISFSSPEG